MLSARCPTARHSSRLGTPLSEDGDRHVLDPPNWTGLLWATALLALVLAVEPFVAPRVQLASCDITTVCEAEISASAPGKRDFYEYKPLAGDRELHRMQTATD